MNSEAIVESRSRSMSSFTAGIFFDERVGARNVGFRLVIIEVADEVFDGVVREKTFELGVKLRGERFVVRDDERGLVDVSDDVGDGESFSRTGDAQQRLVLRAGQNAGGQLFNRLRLVAGGRVIGNEFEHGLKVESAAARVNGLATCHFCRTAQS